MNVIFNLVIYQLLISFFYQTGCNSETVTKDEAFPKIREPTTQYISNANPIVRFHCGFVDNVRLPVNIVWTLNNRVLNHSTEIDDFHFSILNDSEVTKGFISILEVGKSTLSVLPTKLRHEFHCLLTNHLGSIRSKAAFLRDSVLSNEFLTGPSKRYVQTGHPIILPCRLHSVPKAIIQWKFQSQFILPQISNNSLLMLNTGSLLIFNADSSHTGEYQCIGTNEVLNKTITIAAVKVIVEDNSGNWGDKKPQFVKVYDNLDMNIQSKHFSLICVAEGFPIPEIHWENPSGYIISYSNIVSSMFDSNETEIKFKCVAKNYLSEINQVFTVRQVAAPNFDQKSIMRQFPSSQIIKLDCHIQTVPMPTIQWFKNGQLLIGDARIKRTNSRLTINHSFSSDSGYYQCFATNDYGEDYLASYLYLNAAAKIPKSPENISCKPFDAQSICLKWDAQQNVPFVAYSIHEISDGRSREYVSILNSYLVKNLRINQVYEYYVRLYSEQASDPSTSIYCQTERTRERNLKYTEIKNSSVLIEWSILNSDVKCGSDRKPLYKFQWKKFDDKAYKTVVLLTNVYAIYELLPGTMYYIQIIPLTAAYGYGNRFKTVFYLHNVDGFDYDNDNDNDDTDSDENSKNLISYIPMHLKAVSTTFSCIFLSWEHLYQNIEIDHYDICYYELPNTSANNSCVEDDDFLHTNSTKIQIESNSNRIGFEICDLEPFTFYEMKICSVDINGTSSLFSEWIQCQTMETVPGEVANLEYKKLNETTFSIQWLPPSEKNGVITSYIMSYMIESENKKNSNDIVNQWVPTYIPVDNKTRGSTEDEIVLYNLTVALSKNEYLLIVVQATTSMGEGKATLPIMTKPIANLKEHLKKIMIQNSKKKQQIVAKQEINTTTDTLSLAVLILTVLILGLIVISLILLHRKRFIVGHNHHQLQIAVANSNRKNFFIKICHHLHNNPENVAVNTTDVQEMQHLMLQSRPLSQDKNL